MGQGDIFRAHSTEPQLSVYRTPVQGINSMVFHRMELYSSGELETLNLNIRYHEGLPVDFKNPRGEPCLFILDDMLNDTYSSGLVCDLYTKGSHHRNISIILITQNMFHQSKHCQDISLNAKYLVLLKKR